MIFTIYPLLLSSLAFAKPLQRSDDKSIVYAAYSRSPKPSNPTRFDGLDQPLRQNGTWIDVGIWQYREDVISNQPFLFTLSPGHNESTHVVVPYSASSSTNTNSKLAYSEGSLEIPVNYGALSAFVLTDVGNTADQIVDAWTVTKDEYGRMLLGIAGVEGDLAKGKTWGYGGGNMWVMNGCAWSNGTVCDGFYFFLCAGCFGTPAVLEVVEWKA